MGANGEQDERTSGDGGPCEGCVGKSEHAVRSNAITINDVLTDLLLQLLPNGDVLNLDRTYALGELPIKCIGGFSDDPRTAFVFQGGRLVARVVDLSAGEPDSGQGSEPGR